MGEGEEGGVLIWLIISIVLLVVVIGVALLIWKPIGAVKGWDKQLQEAKTDDPTLFNIDSIQPENIGLAAYDKDDWLYSTSHIGHKEEHTVTITFSEGISKESLDAVSVWVDNTFFTPKNRENDWKKYGASKEIADNKLTIKGIAGDSGVFNAGAYYIIKIDPDKFKNEDGTKTLNKKTAILKFET